MIQSFTCIFKIIFNYESEVEVAWQGFRAAVEFVYSFSFSTVHIYVRKKLDTRQDGHFCVMLCFFGHLSSTKTRKNNSIWYSGSAWNSLWSTSKKTFKLYIFVTMQRWPHQASDNSVNCPEMRVKVLDQQQRAAAWCSADKMRWCEAASREWKREDTLQLNHSRVYRWLI